MTGPAAQGLYDPAQERDACGVAFVADLNGRRCHDVVAKGLSALIRLDHRGARGAEYNTGDGAGIMIQVPDSYFRQVAGIDLPPAGQYATGLVFLPSDPVDADRAITVFEKYALVEGGDVLGWRDVPVVPDGLGESADAARPTIRQVFLAAHRLTGSDAGPAGAPLRDLELDRVAFCIRKQAERETAQRGVAAYFPSLSSRTMTYKGMLTPDQLPVFFPDLTDPRVDSAIALVHSRFSTNTFPSWPLAHPYRFIAHNGEINTIRGNKNWMNAREALLASAGVPGAIKRLFPVCTPDASDSANFDEVLELLHLAGRSLPHAVLMMIPEAWENDPDMDPQRRAFYRFHASLMEPWDGPASVAFTDGSVIGAVLDRNGLRPGRWWHTDDGLVVLGSEAGVLDVDPATVVAKGRLQPGRMFLVDTAAGRIVHDDEIKAELAAERPYADWLHAGLIDLADLPAREHTVYNHDSVTRRQQVFGYSEEELKILVAPMARTGAEPLGSMGTDTPISPLSSRPRLLFDYFHQLFAQVTNPPLDAIREELVTSLATTIGPEGNLLDPGPASCRQIVLPYPIIDNDELAKLLSIDEDGDLPGFKAVRVSGLYPLRDGAAGIKARLTLICRHVSEAIEDGVRILVLSDRDAGADLAPIPSLLLTAAVHQHLVREQTRTQVALVVESGDCREVHHAAVLIGYGAAAVNPYLAFETVEDLIATGTLAGIEPATAVRNYVKALGKGVLKIMSKMGISTVSSYCGAQVFEAVGLENKLIQRYFAGTPGRIGGSGLAEIHAEIAARHAKAYPRNAAERTHRRLEVGGEYQWRREGEIHLFNPETVFLLQHATRSRQYDVFQRYTAKVDGLAAQAGSLRGLFAFKAGRQSVPLDEVEPVDEIVKRFATGAMSYGSISAESHETLAIAMNRLGGKSNTGEGGEDVERLYDPARRSAVKQIASGRFGVTSEYLVNADDLQIKMAQGAKPGEGGQLPGNKVWPWIAKTRYATPGVGLISPPPHHDIYSIEDLAQLVHDLKNVNPTARVHVKLVSEIGVGTVAAGVAKLKADVILISGHDGGTGASPLNSLKHAGTPWELGLAEAQQTLLLNKLRDRVTVQVDGQLKTGRDVIIAALLGAEEFGFATAPLIVSGCIMMRVCHLDTCPVGIATQNPVLRERFTGKPEFVENFFLFIAEEVRGYLAELGFRSIDEAIGHAEVLDIVPALQHWKAKGLDLAPVLHVPDLPEGASRRGIVEQDHGLDKALDNELIALAQPALLGGTRVRAQIPVRNEHRSVGAMLGGEVTRRYGGNGLPDDTIEFTLHGTAGQSFGAFLPRGVTLRLYGDVNDYVGKGLSGGRLIVRPALTAPFAAEENIIAGNTILYGATSGEVFLRGRAGERFAVRNSGAVAVVEGIGDHGCEYMTGGTVVVLGPTGRNFAAGMSGGTAFVWRLDQARINPELVDLTPLTADEQQTLRVLVQQHATETESAVAGRLLADWLTAVAEFTAVVPRDYKRVMELIRTAEAAGRNIDEAVMGSLVPDPNGFLRYERQLPQRRPVPVRIRDWREVYPAADDGLVRDQATRCMDCGIPFCHDGCPLGNRIPDWNDLVRTGAWAAAAESLHATNNFPEFTGRLCPAPCESACVLAIGGDAVTIKQVEVEIANHAFDLGYVVPQPAPVASGRSVAVVGSGPAGLAAAQQLARAGHAVTVFERDDAIGGLLRYGIPDFKLEKERIDARLAQMTAEGVVFRTGVTVGVDVTAEQLRADVDAVLLACGALAGRDAHETPGRALNGVHLAMEHLVPANRVVAGRAGPTSIDAAGKHVVIIGGGDTGADCLGVAHRQGAAGVIQLDQYPLPPEVRAAERHPWPTWPVILRSYPAHEEGGDRIFGVAVQEFVDDGAGNVCAVRVADVVVERRDGRRVVTTTPGSERDLPADLVLLAIGFEGTEQQPLLEQLGVVRNARGAVDARDDWQTGADGVFVAGDMHRGASLIVWAIAEGRAAAAAIHSYLGGAGELPAPVVPSSQPLAAVH